MRRSIRSYFARLRFAIEKVPHFCVHHLLRSETVRISIKRLLGPFPGIREFLRTGFHAMNRRLSQQRILYQRSLYPNLIIKNRRKLSPVDPAHLAQVKRPTYTVDQVLRNIENELS